MTFPDEPFSSYFSGNTVQICPVGALTATPYRFKARPWDLEQVESTCTGCSVGCRIVVQSSRDELVRKLGVDSEAVNWSWLCDRGRFNYEATNAADRLAVPLVRGEGGLDRDVVERRHGRRRPARARGPRRRRPAAASPCSAGRAARTRTPSRGPRSPTPSARRTATPSSATACRPPSSACPGRRSRRPTAAATVVLLAPDLKEELPVLFLRLRHAAEQRKVKIVEIGPADTGLTRHAWRSIRVEAGATGCPAVGARRPRDRRPARAPARSWSSPGGRTSPSRPRRPRRRAQDGPRRLPGRPACCRRCGAATSSAPCSSASPRRRAGSTPPASSRPPRTGASTSSSCSVPIRSTTSRTPTSPAGPSPVPAASSASTRS